MTMHGSDSDLVRFDATRALELLEARGSALGRPLTVVAETESTNDDAMRRARAGAAHGATFVAEHQSRGRGRRGAAWSSRPGEDLTFSAVVRPRLAPELVGGLSLVAGLAVRAAAATRVARPVRIKWPNDVLVDDRKLAGILVESQFQAQELAAAVIGIGINVRSKSFPAPLDRIATSLALLEGTPLDRESLFVDILLGLHARLASYERSGFAAIHSELCAHDALIGTPIRVDAVAGIAAGFDGQGHLLLSDSNGTLHTILSGTVERI
jgi:BirA family transcriptional regulator, biotin operon repressor / biotin---[acetyl-CoA-carboxylase] ligase